MRSTIKPQGRKEPPPGVCSSLSEPSGAFVQRRACVAGQSREDPTYPSRVARLQTSTSFGEARLGGTAEHPGRVSSLRKE